MTLTWRVLFGDVREELRTLEGGSVRTCITSPPFWGLRDYGTASWVDGDPACRHMVPATGSTQNRANNNREGTPFRDVCRLCGARRVDRQIGLELSPDAYVAELVGVAREIRRVLADDGTLWINLGDSYATGAGLVGACPGGGEQGDRARGIAPITQPNRLPIAGLKPKDLVGIPWRVAFALQADGWYLRSDIVWAKPNPMPESVTDRPTKSHEYIFLFAKSARYYYDANAIREEGAGRTDLGKMTTAARLDAGGPWTNDAGEKSEWGRNKRSVWTVATMPYADAHFATFPEALIEPCVLAGSAIGDLVLDPFCGSGTTGAVAVRHQRAFVGVELNPAYVELARDRIGGVAPLFAREADAGADGPVAGDLFADVAP